MAAENRIEKIYPLSPMQSGMLFHSLMSGESNAYFVQNVFRIKGDIDKNLLQKSFNLLIKRYDILRTVFRVDQLKEPLQFVLKQREFRIYFEDISYLSENEKQVFLEEFKIKDRKRGFDLTRDILIRVSLFRTGLSAYNLVWSLHHILIDGWCLGILYKELIQIYRSLKEKEPLEVEAVIPYVKYIKWLEKQDKEEGLCYWKKYLEGYEQQALLPKKGKFVDDDEYKLEEYHFVIDNVLTSALNNIALENQVTLNTVFQTLWGILLQRYNNCDDVVFGAVVSGRPSEIEGVENIVGLFINTVPVRIKSHENQGIFELLRTVQEESLSSKSYEYLSLAEIHSNSALKENLINHIMIFENYPLYKEVKNTGIEQDLKYIFDFNVEHLEIREQTNYGFNIIIIPGKSITVKFNYNAFVYENDLIKNIQLHLKEIVKNAVANPGKAVKEIEIITVEERQQILYDFNQTGAAYPKDKTIHQLFEEQVEKTPGQIALVGSWKLAIGEEKRDHPYIKEQVQITYKQLNEQANQLAYLLREKSVEPDTIVGIMVERSVEMIIGLLGILKAGGAYLPIDPDYPKERIDYMLKDSAAEILLTANELSDCIWNRFACPDSLPETGNRQPATSLAYVLYTSGSTKGPKGVMVNHRNVVRLVKNTNFIRFEKNDRILQTGALEFDASTFEIWGALLNVLSFYTTSRDNILNSVKLKKIITYNRITTMWLTSPLFNQLVQSDVSIFTALRNLLVGGDVLSPDHINKTKRRFPGLRIINGYGPTENTTFSTTFLIDREYKEKIPIGKPIANSTAYIVDKSGNLLPFKIPGELYLGGDGVARGYLNNPELTFERFINYKLQITNKNTNTAHPLALSNNTSTHYKTGDFACWMQDGNIEFLGRIDCQVKIRGFRVELGEIEDRLLNLDEIDTAVVLVKEDENKEKYLCAYIVAKKEGVTAGNKIPVDFSEIRKKLSKSLPDYMIPSYIAELKKIPLTPNGKVDRKALPEPQPRCREDYIAPRNELEIKLVAIWAEVLNINKELVSINSNFFELGGHSLKATILSSRIHKELNVKIPLTEILKTQTITRLSEYIRGASLDKFESIELVEKKEYYPMSSVQKRLYILQQMELESIAYNMPNIITLSKEFELEKLERTFFRLINRHESLRTSFYMSEDIPIQRILEKVDFKIEYFDFKIAQDKVNVEAAKKNFIRPFDLSNPPLLRVGLIKVNENKTMLIVDMHHIISDGTSHAVLEKDFMGLYNGEELEPLRTQYKDYSEWQNSSGQQEKIKKQEEYWLKKFEGEIPVLELPTDYPRPMMQSFEGNSLNFDISVEETRALNAIALKGGSTLYMVLVAVVNILLSKLSGQEEIIIGTPIAGRKHAELDKIIGMFVNTLSLKNYPAGDRTFREFLCDVKERTLMDFENQDYPFEELVDKLSVNRDMGRNPLFDIMFVLQNINTGLGGQDKETEIEISRQIQPDFPKENESIFLTAKFDLTLTAMERGHKLFISFQYCTKLFKKETIERFTRYFKKIASSIVENPGIKLCQIYYISEEERNQIICEFNNTSCQYPHEKTIHRLFAEQVEKSPDSIAVIGTAHSAGRKAQDLREYNYFLPTPGTGNGQLVRITQLTYRELNENSNQMANQLRAKGIQPDTIVGIMMERSLEMIIGIFGILKSGAAYLPIHPGYPEARIHYMLADSGVNILLTIPGLYGKLKKRSIVNCQLLMVNQKSPARRNLNNTTTEVSSINNYQLTSDNLQLEQANLVYVIYTSGTTGEPKGVAVKHGSLVNRLNWMQKKYPIYKNDTILHKTSFTFDVSVWEIFWWSFTGAKVCLLIPGGEKDPGVITQTIERNNVTTMHFVPSMLNVFLDDVKSRGDEKKLWSLRQVIASGEALSLSIVERFSELSHQGNGIKLANLYGPTEATIDVSYFDCLEGGEREIIAIGKPIDNIRLYILDKHLHIQPIGISGELCISGIGLARGYLNRPELTAEKFDNDLWDYQDYHDKRKKASSPYSPHSPYLPYSPIYRTGDLARWKLDGNIEFLGRIDHQVKIRGFRIELGEIENRLLNHEEIKEAVVISKKDEHSDKYLCAYFVANSEIPEVELREYLSKKLPDYMIPAYFVQMEQMPLTPNGKIDKKVLPELEREVGESYISPGNKVEEKLVEIWSEVLGIDKNVISIDANFFRLDGHSIKATIMTAKVHKELGVELPLAAVFKTPSIRKLAEIIKELRKEKYASVEPTEKKEFYPLSSAQKRMYILQQMDEQGVFCNMPNVWILEGEIDKDKLEDIFKKLIERHESLRTSFHMLYGEREPVLKVHENIEFAIEYFEIEECRGDISSSIEVEKIINDFVRPFDLSQTPLLRSGLINTHPHFTLSGQPRHSIYIDSQNEDAKDRYILMVDKHHVISDGVSHDILARDFILLHREEELPQLRLQYKDYLEWLRSDKQQKLMKRQKKYWLNAFNGGIPGLNIRTDYQRPVVQNFAGNNLYFELNKKSTAALKSLALRENATIHMVMLAIFNVFLSKLSSQEDIIIGITTTGRSHADLDNIIGMFSNTLPLRNFPNREKMFLEFLREVKQNSQEAYENQDYPFEELVKNVMISRDPGRNPLIDIVFEVQSRLPLPDEHNGHNEPIKKTSGKRFNLHVRPYGFERKITVFDMIWTGMDIGERIFFTINYNTSLFEKESIELLIDRYVALIGNVIQNAGSKIKDMDYRTDIEKGLNKEMEIDFKF